MAENLLWKPTGDFVRFVFAVTSRRPIVLMCSDLATDPLTAIRLYCARTGIETTSDMLKNLTGAFRYRFWSKGLPLHSRKPKKKDRLKAPLPYDVANVRNCWTGIEGFAMIAAISLGILQLVSDFRDLNGAVTRMVTLVPGGRITVELVDEEMGRLREMWRSKTMDSGDFSLVEKILEKQTAAQLDRFDRGQLEGVLCVCVDSKSLSSAGKKHFAVSRTRKKKTNDADRLKKYLSRFGIGWKVLRI